MRSPVFYKFLSGVLALLLAAGGVLAGVMIYHAQQEADHFRKDKELLAGELANATLKLERNQDFLARLENDPEFLDRLARVRLGYAKPDEMIFRFDPDAVTSAPATGNETALHNQVNPPPPKKTSPAPKPATKPAGTARTARQ